LNPTKRTRRKRFGKRNKGPIINTIGQDLNTIKQQLDEIKIPNSIQRVKRKKNKKGRRYQQLANREFVTEQNMNVKSLKTMMNELYSSYERSLLFPEYVDEAKIPGFFPIPTVSLHKKFSYTVPANASGCIAWCVNPVMLSVSSASAGYHFFNNDSTLNLISAGGGTYQSAPSFASIGVPANSFTAWRLVSASMVVTPLCSINTAQGYIANCITTRQSIATVSNTASFPNGTGTATVFGGSSIQANVDSGMYYTSTRVGVDTSIRALYVPFDPSFSQFLGLGQSRYVAYASAGDDFWWYGYGTGLANACEVQFDFYVNYELEPDIETFYESIACPCNSKENTQKVLENITATPQLITQVSEDLQNKVATAHSGYMEGTPTSGIFEKVIDWTTENSGILSKLAKFGIGMLTPGFV